MFIKASFGIAFCAMGIPSLAVADITPQELVDHWMSSEDIRFDASLAPRDDGVSLDGVEIGLSGGRGGTLQTDRIDLTETDDGKVSIGFAAPVRLRPETPEAGMSLSIDLGSATVLADRVGDGFVYDTADPQLEVTLNGTAAGSVDMRYVLRDYSGRIETGDRLSAPVTLLSDAADIDGTVTIPAESGDGVTRIALVATDLDTASRVETAAGFLASMVSASVPPLSGTSELASLRLAVDIPGPRGRTALGLDIEGVTVNSSIAENGVSTNLATGGVSVALAAPNLPPFEPAATIDGLSYDLALPIVEGAEAPLELDLAIDGIVPDDAVWSLFDPQETLPRDPGSLTLNITGRATPVAPVAGPQDGGVPAGLPFDVARISLDALGLSALGATISGQGQVSRPLDPAEADGEIVLNGTGVLELLGVLSELGLIAPDQELGARFALGFATVPNPDGDGLRSTITFDDGSIRLNDQAVRQ